MLYILVWSNGSMPTNEWFLDLQTGYRILQRVVIVIGKMKFQSIYTIKSTSWEKKICLSPSFHKETKSSNEIMSYEIAF